MNSRIWRAGALAASIAVVVLVATQTAAGQSTVAGIGGTGQPVRQDVPADPSSQPTMPESGNLLLLGSAFVVVAQQLRRLA